MLLFSKSQQQEQGNQVTKQERPRLMNSFFNSSAKGLASHHIPSTFLSVDPPLFHGSQDAKECRKYEEGQAAKIHLVYDISKIHHVVV